MKNKALISEQKRMKVLAGLIKEYFNFETDEDTPREYIDPLKKEKEELADSINQLGIESASEELLIKISKDWRVRVNIKSDRIIINDVITLKKDVLYKMAEALKQGDYDNAIRIGVNFIQDAGFKWNRAYRLKKDKNSNLSWKQSGNQFSDLKESKKIKLSTLSEDLRKEVKKLMNEGKKFNEFPSGLKTKIFEDMKGDV